MQFKIYDVLSSLIPGTMVLGVLLLTGWIMNVDAENWMTQLSAFKDFSGIITSIFLVISYVTGYIIHAMGSWIEPILWFTWKGRPSELLLKNKTKRLGLVGVDAILKHLVKYAIERGIVIDKQEELTQSEYRSLFQVAKTLAYTKAEGSIKERMAEFNNSYIFARNILISVFLTLLSSFHWVWNGIIEWWWILALIVLQILLWYRCRDKAIYYSREILTAAFYSNTKD